MSESTSLVSFSCIPHVDAFRQRAEAAIDASQQRAEKAEQLLVDAEQQCAALSTTLGQTAHALKCSQALLEARQITEAALTSEVCCVNWSPPEYFLPLDHFSSSRTCFSPLFLSIPFSPVGAAAARWVGGLSRGWGCAARRPLRRFSKRAACAGSGGGLPHFNTGLHEYHGSRSIRAPERPNTTAPEHKGSAAGAHRGRR